MAPESCASSGCSHGRTFGKRQVDLWCPHTFVKWKSGQTQNKREIANLMRATTESTTSGQSIRLMLEGPLELFIGTILTRTTGGGGLLGKPSIHSVHPACRASAPSWSLPLTLILTPSSGWGTAMTISFDAPSCWVAPLGSFRSAVSVVAVRSTTA